MGYNLNTKSLSWAPETNTVINYTLVMTNLDSILKSRAITLPKVCLLKAMVFPVVMYGCESWTIKKAKCQRIDAFELGCWRRLLRDPRTARRSTQYILKEISPEYSLEGLMLKLEFQYFGYLMGRVDSLTKTVMVGTIEGRWRRGWQRTRWLDGITDPMARRWWRIRKAGVLQSMESQRAKHNWGTEQEQIDITSFCLELGTVMILRKCSIRFLYSAQCWQ